MPEPASITLFTTGCVGLTVRLLQRKYRAVKPYFDRTVAAMLFVLFSPVMVACGLLVKLTSRGPVFYTQERVGQNGRVFKIFKFRTMRADAEVSTGPVWCSGEGDPRITSLGRFLRQTHLDELPQLINVIRGDMSLIGPRPERPEFVSELAKRIPDYERRLSVRPGITGLAQIRAGYDRSLRDVRRKVKLDCLYIRRMCWWVDFMIITGTLVNVLKGRRKTAESQQDLARA